MLKQVSLLVKLQMYNVLGINQIRYSKDRKQRSRFILMFVVYGILAVTIAIYSVSTVYALFALKLSSLTIPLFVLLLSMIILIFSFLKAGSVIFNMRTYEMLSPLPVSPAAIVVSRFSSMYLQNLAITGLVMVPAMIAYGVLLNMGVSFYLLMFVGLLFIPLIPITIATCIGALIVYISVRTKHKTLITILLSVIVVIALILLPSLFSQQLSFHMNDFLLRANSFEISEQLLQQIVKIAHQQILSLYPLALWFSNGVRGVDIMQYVWFITLSVAIFIGFVAVVQWKFYSISSALYSHRFKANYKMQELAAGSVAKALYRKELKLYFSSSIYVLNTAIIFLMGIVVSIGLFVTGIKQVEQLLPGINLTKFAPMIPVMIFGLISTTSSSISMEGKQWWIAQSLPIEMKQIIKSKIMINLTIAIPSYLISQVFYILTFRPTALDLFWLLLLPLVYLGLNSILGIALNLKMPVFDWESETVAVKQGGALLLTMLITLSCAILPFALVFVIDYHHLVFAFTSLVITGLTWRLYQKTQALDIRSIHGNT